MKYFILFLGLISSFSVSASLLVKGIERNGLLKITSVTEDSRVMKAGQKKYLRSVPHHVGEFKKITGEQYVEFLISEKDAGELGPIPSRPLNDVRFDEKVSEVRVLIQQGPWDNRINFTIVGDGYTLSEKDKFFADAQRMANDLFVKQTFQSFLPLFNVSAVFVASNKSGIGDGSPIDTAFKLYRSPKGSKRGIMPGDENSLDRAISLAPATTYPIVIANDDFYGGLGGKYAISTRSEQSGLIVLRHELGHTIGEVGEEYDNGSAYFGANSARSVSAISWKQWIKGPLKVNDAALLSGDYVWQNLKEKDYTSKFSNSIFPQGLFYGEISSVGWETAQDVTATLNGVVLPLLGTFSADRNFYDVAPAKLSAGTHVLKISENIKDGNNVLGFAQLWTVPADYDFTPNQVAAFATLPDGGGKTYRPTHRSCAMRNMQTEHFCVVDQENLWLKMLNNVSLIDSLTSVPESSGLVSVKLQTILLPNLEIHWFQKTNGKYVEILQSEGQLGISLAKGSTVKVTVDFHTPEVVLQDSSMHAEKEIKL